MLQSGLYFTSTTLFVLNAVMCSSLYQRSPRVPLLRDPAFYAEVFNVLPGVGYWATRWEEKVDHDGLASDRGSSSMLQLVAHAQLVALHDSSSALYRASVDVLRLVRSGSRQFFFVVIFFFF
jgi:hypothetical protein